MAALFKFITEWFQHRKVGKIIIETDQHGLTKLHTEEFQDPKRFRE